MSTAYMFPDGSGFSYPWELHPLGKYTLHGKGGLINGYQAQITMAVSYTCTLHVACNHACTCFCVSSILCLSPFQTESKFGFILLQSCAGCTSNVKIIGLAEKLLLEAVELLAASPIPPRLPPSPQDYLGSYTTIVRQQQVWEYKY